MIRVSSNRPAMAKREIEQKKVRLITFQQLDRGRFIASGTADRKVRVFREHSHDTTANQLVVIDDKDRIGSLALCAVPFAFHRFLLIRREH